MSKQIYNLTREEVFAKFNTSENGLAEEESERRFKDFGRNVVEKKQNWNMLTLMLNQFNSALVWILLVAAVLAAFLGEIRDTVIIFIIIGINAIIGFLQEYKAEKTLENIRKLATDSALVMRSGKREEIDASWLVPGDVVILSPGDSVPADGYIFEGYDLYVNEFIFTGESKPGKKIAAPIAEENVALADCDNMLFMGTALTRGEAKMVVTGTGMQTELGRIANLVVEVKEEETPLQKQMRILGRDVTILALFVGSLVLIAGYYYQLSWYENFLFALALSVSVVPEGLPAAISVALSLGMRRLLKKQVLAKKLNAVETLASVSVICTDKTGTITRNELMVTNMFLASGECVLDGAGYEPKGNFYFRQHQTKPTEIQDLEMLCRIGALCNEAGLIQKNGAYAVTGDPTEGAILVATRKYEARADFFLREEEKVDEIPFSSERMRMDVAYRNKQTGKTISYIKGSPDVLLEKCSEILSNGRVIEFTQAEKQKVQAAYNTMSKDALRVLGFAYKEIKVDADFSAQTENDLVWVGLMGMIDPPRQDVKRAVEECLASGIKVVMITGDYEITAGAIARSVGLMHGSEGEVINGRKLDILTDAEILEKIKTKDVVFARINPEQKLRIATLLKNADLVIAMTGDGVNDAPALKKADIGVAMGKIGTDVSKEAADMILLDDNFASIVKVIKEGRTIYQNLKKFVHYVFTSNASEFFTVIIGVLLQIPAPIVAVQILAIDLGTDIFPSFSLGMEPSEPTVMKRKPFSLHEKILSSKGAWRIIQLGIVMATGAVITFILSMKRGGWDFGNKIDPSSVLYVRSTTAAYAVLSMTQMANLLQSRSESLSVFTLGLFKNIYAIGAIFISVGMLLLFIYSPFINKYLHMTPIGWQDWIAVAVCTLVVFLYEEARKAEVRGKN